MQAVTAQLTERMGLVAEMAEDRSASPAVTASAPRRPSAAADRNAAPPVASAATAAAAQQDEAAQALAQVAMLLNNVELRGMGRRFGRDSGGRGRDGGSGFPAGRSGSEGGFRGPGPGERPSPSGADAVASPPAIATPPAESDQPPAALAPSGAPGEPAGRRRFPRGPAPDGVAGPPAQAAPSSTGQEADRIEIDMMPIRREITRQFATDDEWRNLSQEERQRIISLVNQQMLGFAKGIRLAASEAQKKVLEAQKAADEKAHEIAAAARTKAPAAPAVPGAPSAPNPPAAPALTTDRPGPGRSSNASAGGPTGSEATERRSAFSGSRLNVTVERGGQVIRQLNAEVNIQNLLGTVFEVTQRNRGEVPFAVASDGHLYTPTVEDRQTIEHLGHSLTRPDTPVGTAVLPEWIVVTTAGPAGSGLKFGIARPIGDSLNTLRRSAARSAAFGLGFICLALIGIVPISSRLTRNLSALNDGVTRIAHGDYRARVPVRSHDEVGRLAQAFNQMAEDVEKHQRSAVEQERLKRELELGRQIQHDMLPQSLLKLGLTEVKGVSVPAREVGGDFFNYFAIGADNLALVVGDVSGKGVGAALLMANLQASLRTRLALGQDLAVLARELDAEIEASTPGPVYATLFVAILDTSSRELRYVNAGHHPQFVLRRGQALEPMGSSGLPVGLLAGRGYTERRVPLVAGDVLFFYTDGCVEAENEAGDMYGPERLERALLSALADGGDVLSRVEADIAAFRAGHELFDDATLMVVRIG
jgi:serine phosphatase RsbU (regulator of sigma subunit)